MNDRHTRGRRALVYGCQAHQGIGISVVATCALSFSILFIGPSDNRLRLLVQEDVMTRCTQ